MIGVLFEPQNSIFMNAKYDLKLFLDLNCTWNITKCVDFIAYLELVMIMVQIQANLLFFKKNCE